MTKHVLMKIICLVFIMVELVEMKSKNHLLDLINDTGKQLKHGKLSQSYFVPIGKLNPNKHALQEQLLELQLAQGHSERKVPNEYSNGIVIQNLTVIYNPPDERINTKRSVERCFCGSNRDEISLDSLQRCSCSSSQNVEQSQSELLQALARCDCSLRASFPDESKDKEKVVRLLGRCGCRAPPRKTLIDDDEDEQSSILQNIARCDCALLNEVLRSTTNERIYEKHKKCGCRNKWWDKRKQHPLRVVKDEDVQTSILQSIARCDCALLNEVLRSTTNERIYEKHKKCGCRNKWWDKRKQHPLRVVMDKDDDDDVEIIARCSCFDDQTVHDSGLRELLDRCDCQLVDNSHDYQNYGRSVGNLLLDDLTRCDCSTVDRMTYNSDQDVDNVKTILARCGCSNNIYNDLTSEVARCDCSRNEKLYPRTREEEVYLSNLLARCNCGDLRSRSLSDAVRGKDRERHRSKINILPLHLLLPIDKQVGSKKYESDFEFEGVSHNKYYTPNSLVKYIFDLQNSIVNGTVSYINERKPGKNSLYKSFSFLTDEQQRKIDLLKLYRNTLSDNEVRTVARDIIFGKSGPIDNLIKKQSLRSSGPYYILDNQYNPNEVLDHQYREDAPKPENVPVKTTIMKKTLLPLTKKQKLKKSSIDLLKNVRGNFVDWGHKGQRKSLNGQQVAPFEVQLDGLVQLNS